MTPKIQTNKQIKQVNLFNRSWIFHRHTNVQSANIYNHIERTGNLVTNLRSRNIILNTFMTRCHNKRSSVVRVHPINNRHHMGHGPPFKSCQLSLVLM